MAITRRQFVTRLGALAAAAGMSQADVAKLTEAFAYGSPGLGGTFGKPRVVWIHGAECTGCTTSLLSIFEDTTGTAIEGTSISTGAALGLAGTLPTSGHGGAPDLAFHATGYNVDGAAVNIADVVVDVLDIKYHETLMSMGGDLAYKMLKDFIDTAEGDQNPFVLVVEGALQDKGNGTTTGGGAWNDFNADVSWCSIGMNDAGTAEHDMAATVAALAIKSSCLAVIPIGQCATFGGYPGCKPPITQTVAGFDPTKSQTGAKGTEAFLKGFGIGSDEYAAAAKVINVPGCPTNPWWFVLSVVAFLVDLQVVLGSDVGTQGTLGVLEMTGGGIAIKSSAVDKTRRLKAVYGTPIHGPACPRYQDFVNGTFATKPGEAGCLQLIGCKGPSTNSLCTLHGWDGQQPHNNSSWDQGVATTNLSKNGKKTGGFCVAAGHPCMGCTEKGYPDAMVPFVLR